MFGSEFIRIKTSIKTARSAVFFFAVVAKFWKRDISSASESAFPGFFGEIFGGSTLLKRDVLVHKNSLASYQRCSHSIEPRALTCPFKQSNLSVWSYPSLEALGMTFSLLYVVSYNLFWNCNGVVRFVSQEVWFDKGFVIWHFLNYCLVQIMSLWSLSIGVGIIFTTNELVDRTRNFKSNTSRFKQKNVKKLRRRPDFLWNKMCRRQDLSNKMRRRPNFLT